MSKGTEAVDRRAVKSAIDRATPEDARMAQDRVATIQPGRSDRPFQSPAAEDAASPTTATAAAPPHTGLGRRSMETTPTAPIATVRAAAAANTA